MLSTKGRKDTVQAVCVQKRGNPTRIGTKRKKILKFIFLPLILALLQCMMPIGIAAAADGTEAEAFTENSGIAPGSDLAGAENSSAEAELDEMGEDGIMPLDIKSDTYMLNNKYSGHWISCYVKGSGKPAILTTGTFEEREYDWAISIEEYEIPGTYVIRSVGYPGYNLCCIGANEEAVWVPGPHRMSHSSEANYCCRWYIDYIAGGEYTIRNRGSGA